MNTIETFGILCITAGDIWRMASNVGEEKVIDATVSKFNKFSELNINGKSDEKYVKVKIEVDLKKAGYSWAQ